MSPVPYISPEQNTASLTLVFRLKLLVTKGQGICLPQYRLQYLNDVSQLSEMSGCSAQDHEEASCHPAASGHMYNTKTLLDPNDSLDSWKWCRNYKYIVTYLLYRTVGVSALQTITSNSHSQFGGILICTSRNSGAQVCTLKFLDTRMDASSLDPWIDAPHTSIILYLVIVIFKML